MNLLIISDCHFEHHKDWGLSFIKSLPDADVISISGDMTSCSKLRWTFAQLAQKYKNILYVLGNHEFYGVPYNKTTDTLKSICDDMPEVLWLNDSSVTIKDKHFLGCTLWFEDNPLLTGVENNFSDFNYIDSLRNWVYYKNMKSRKFLEEKITKDSIVITHHLPCGRSLDPKFDGNICNGFYVSLSCEKIIAEKCPKIWIHGHTHKYNDYQFMDTRIICNPFGYVTLGENSHYVEDFIISV